MITLEQAKELAYKEAIRDGFDFVRLEKKENLSFVFAAGCNEIRDTGLPPYYIVNDNGKCSFYSGFKYLR